MRVLLVAACLAVIGVSAVGAQAQAASDSSSFLGGLFNSQPSYNGRGLLEDDPGAVPGNTPAPTDTASVPSTGAPAAAPAGPGSQVTQREVIPNTGGISNTNPVVQTVSKGPNFPCHKGVFWPFSRDKGDCLTAAEKEAGMTGTYHDPHPELHPPVTQASLSSSDASKASGDTGTAPAAAANTQKPAPTGCHKGFFWPFSREKGDCLTAAEKKAGMTGTYHDPDGPGGQ